MAHVHLAQMGDEEAQFPGHSCSPEPAEVSDFHGLQWLGRGPTTAAVQLLTLTRMQNRVLHHVQSIKRLNGIFTSTKIQLDRSEPSHTQTGHWLHGVNTLKTYQLVDETSSVVVLLKGRAS